MARKHKLNIRNRSEFRPWTHKVEGPLPDDEALANAMEGANWSDDPGTGKSVQLEDGREVLNPLPVAPPASIAARAAEPSVNELVERALKRHFEQLKEADEIDTLADADDFGEDDDFTPFSQFEVNMIDEGPAIPKGVSTSAFVQADLDKLEAAAKKADLDKPEGAGKKVDPKKKAPVDPEPVEES